MYSSFLWVPMLGFLLILFIAYVSSRAVPDFPRMYVKVFSFICIISLIFYFPTQISNAFDINFKNYFEPIKANLDGYYHIYIHNFRIDESTTSFINQESRNAGMFWEPGAFGGYILLALIILNAIKKTLPHKEYWYQFILLTISLITTKSTASYLLYPFVFIPIISWDTIKKHRIAFLAVLFSFLFLATLIYDLPFMKDKINAELEDVAMQNMRYQASRIGGFIFDIEDIMTRPLFGWGPDPTLRFSTHPGLETVLLGAGNGLTGYIVKFGFSGLIIYIIYSWRSFKKITNSSTSSTFIVLFVLALLVNEYFMNYPLFLSLMFIGKPLMDSRNNQSNRQDIQIKQQ